MQNKTQANDYDLEVWTEGKTDWQILKKASEKLGLNLRIKFQEFENDMGDSQLLKRCETFSEKQQPIPMVFIFDHDKKDIIEKVMEPDKLYKCWGNNVFSFAIPVPTHRKGYQNISIEFYFSDAEIQMKSSQERRLFLTSEFMEVSGKLKVDPKISLGNKNILKGYSEQLYAKIIDTEVFDEKNKNIALSKADFAKLLIGEVEPFGNLKFDSFQEIMNLLRSIVSVSRPSINIYLPDLDAFEVQLKTYDPSERLEKILGTIFDVAFMSLCIFSATTIRSYEDAINSRHEKRNKRAEAIEKVLINQFTTPSLKDYLDLARTCFHIIDNNASDELIAMKNCLEKIDALGEVGHLLEDLDVLFPQKAFTPKLVDKHKLQRSFLEFTAKELAKYHDANFSSFRSVYQDANRENIDSKVWLESLRKIIVLLQPIFCNPLELRTLENIDSGAEKCVISVSRYECNDVNKYEESVPLDEADQYESNTTDIVLGQNRIHLYPFLLIKDDQLYIYKRGRAVGFEYRSLSGSSYTKITKKKISKYIIRAGSRQARFWVDIIPTVNQSNGVMANIPDEDLTNFVGRHDQIKTVVEEIIEIPNQNGIVYGPGGIGKTALMIQLSKVLYNEKSQDNVLYKHIVWVSAKSDLFDYDFGTVEQYNPQVKKLSQILSAILEYFGNEDANEYKLEDKKSIVLDLLNDNKILLILDNVETILPGEMDKIIKFFGIEVKRALRKRPENFKVIITSRRQIPCDFHQIQLKGLDEKESIELMDKLSENYKYKLPLSNNQKQKLHHATRGIPIVIKHCFVKLFVNNETFDTVVESLELYSSEIVQFSFKELLRQIETLDKEKIQLNILILLELTNIPLMVRQIAEILEVEEIAVSSRIPILVDFQCLTRMPFERNEKYFINPEIRLLTRALTRNYQDLSKTIREKIVRNFSENRQLEYTIQEAEIISVFDSYLSDRDILDAEDFINSKLKEYPQSIILKYYYANYLKNRKKNEKAIELLNSIRTPSGNQPAILKLLIECYITSIKPRYEEAEILVEALERVSHHNDENLCLVCEYYVEWSTYVNLFSPRGNKLEEIQRREKYKALARNALSIIEMIQTETHKLNYWRSVAYFNIWDYERALSYIDKAIELAIAEGSMDVVNYESQKNEILAKRLIYGR